MLAGISLLAFLTSLAGAGTATYFPFLGLLVEVEEARAVK